MRHRIAALLARKNTLTPTLLSLASAAVYLAVAAPLAPTIGLPALAFANSLMIIVHCILMYIVLSVTIGTLNIRQQLDNLWRLALASVGMSAVIWGLLRNLPSLNSVYFSDGTAVGAFTTVVVIGLAGTGVYFLLAALLRIDEVRMIGGIVGSRLRKRRAQG